QIPLPPSPFGIESDQRPGITSGEQPIAPQALLPRGGHGPGETGGQEMGAEGAGAQHERDRGGRGRPARRERRKHRTVGVMPRTPPPSGLLHG
ncbi:hypothetical protein STRTUCAR8_00636, partial [Streptomyces turgidiscabies Car8]